MAIINLFASTKESHRIEEIIVQAMTGYIIQKEDEELQIQKKKLLKNKTICKINSKINADGEDVNFFTGGFVGYLSQELTGDEQLKQKILYQAVHINTMISFQIHDKEIGNLEFMDRFFTITKQIGGLIYLQSGYILDAQGTELVDPEGLIIADDVLVEVETTADDVTQYAAATVENQGRRTATIEKLKASHIPFAEQMPLLPDSEQVKLKTVEQIARRATAVLIVIQFVREVLDDTEKANIKTSKRIAEVFLNRYGVKMDLTAKEEAFLEKGQYEQQELIDQMWLYEAVWTMYWSIGLVEDLKEPTEICDVAYLLDVLSSFTNIGELLQNTEQQSRSEILNAMDENYLYHWACVDHRMKGQIAPAGLDEGVVMERQRAFNWMTQLNNEQWDDVTMNT